MMSRLAVLSPSPGRFYATLLVNDGPVLFTLLDMSAFNDDDEEWVRSLNRIRNDLADIIEHCRTKSD